MDQITIEALEIDTFIGVHDYEHQFPQRLLLDLTIWWDIKAAATADDLKLTIDYATVCSRLREYARENSVQLVETLAERMASILSIEFAIRKVQLHLRKPSALADAAAVGVLIEREF